MYSIDKYYFTYVIIVNIIMSMEKKTGKIDLTLFKTMFVISMSTFGGGFVIITLMQKKFCDELAWIKREEILNLTAIAQSAPGSLAVNAAILFGYQVRGLKGALIAVSATILPPLLILSVVSLFYNAFIHNQMIQLALQVMRSGVAAVIFDAVLNLLKDVLKTKDLYNILIMISAFIASYFMKVDTIVIVLICLSLGLALEIIHGKQEEIKS
ncbi:hypothetical protein SDC9_122750 [bioreactor metagenome]|uniref:Chromate transport protein n=1 Tax=bioreactor metagenome TaxID=1076179 RepID=A0A645CFJ5_9ZZZZ